MYHMFYGKFFFRLILSMIVHQLSVSCWSDQGSLGQAFALWRCPLTFPSLVCRRMSVYTTTVWGVGIYVLPQMWVAFCILYLAFVSSSLIHSFISAWTSQWLLFYLSCQISLLFCSAGDQIWGLTGVGRACLQPLSYSTTPDLQFNTVRSWLTLFSVVAGALWVSHTWLCVWVSSLSSSSLFNPFLTFCHYRMLQACLSVLTYVSSSATDTLSYLEFSFGIDESFLVLIPVYWALSFAAGLPLAL